MVSQSLFSYSLPSDILPMGDSFGNHEYSWFRCCGSIVTTKPWIFMVSLLRFNCNIARFLCVGTSRAHHWELNSHWKNKYEFNCEWSKLAVLTKNWGRVRGEDVGLSENFPCFQEDIEIISKISKILFNGSSSLFGACPSQIWFKT